MVSLTTSIILGSVPIRSLIAFLDVFNEVVLILAVQCRQIALAPALSRLFVVLKVKTGRDACVEHVRLC